MKFYNKNISSRPIVTQCISTKSLATVALLALHSPHKRLGICCPRNNNEHHHHHHYHRHRLIVIIIVSHLLVNVLRTKIAVSYKRLYI